MKKTIAATLATLATMANVGLAYAQSEGNIAVTKPDVLKITDMGEFTKALVALIFMIAGLLVFVFLVWGGVQWLTSGGDKGATEAARNRITAALVGLAIIAVSWALVAIIGRFFGFRLDNLTVPTPYTS